MTRHTTAPLTVATMVLTIVCLLNGAPVLGSSGDASAAVVKPVRAVVRDHAHGCRWKPRNVAVLPHPLVTFEAPYVPSQCDPLRRLPAQAQRMFECVRWREGGDTADQPNGAGMYQFTNRATWDEFRGRFPEVPSDASPLEQDVVAYRAWKTEQFLPWNGDPCVGSLRQYGKWGWY